MASVKFKIADYYPDAMSECYQIGMAGRCGASCPVFTSGECEEPEEMPVKLIVEEHGFSGYIELVGYYGNKWIR